MSIVLSSICESEHLFENLTHFINTLLIYIYIYIYIFESYCNTSRIMIHMLTLCDSRCKLTIGIVINAIFINDFKIF